MTGTDVTKWGDNAMFESAPMKTGEDLRVTPQVFLLWATPDPLGAIAAAFRMYKGDPTYDLADITDQERRDYWQESMDTYLKAPWEFVEFHFFIEAVTRAFTHQMVRQRTAVYAQESLRFAVKEGLAQETPLPPSVIGNENAETFWQQTIEGIQKGYEALVNLGIPAEDARGLLPHAVTTRLNYKTNMRGLFDVAGKRLCTQAQFEWRAVMLGMIKSIKKYDAASYISRIPSEEIQFQTKEEEEKWSGVDGHNHRSAKWQFELIATPRPGTFTPVCYDAGRCPYHGVLDRNCTIRERVNKFQHQGVKPDQWGNKVAFGDSHIDPVEWMANPNAGRGRDEDGTR